MGTTEKKEIRKQAVRRVLARWIGKRKTASGNETTKETETAADSVTRETDNREKPVHTDNEKTIADNGEKKISSPTLGQPATTGQAQSPSVTVSSRNTQPYPGDTCTSVPQTQCFIDIAACRPP